MPPVRSAFALACGLAVVTAWLTACSEPTATSELAPVRLDIGAAAQASVGPGQTAVFLARVAYQRSITVTISEASAALRLAVLDAMADDTVATAAVTGPAPVRLVTRFTANRTYRIVLTATGGAATFRVGLDWDFDGPEWEAPEIAVGDTLFDGVDFAEDVDVYVFDGTAGEELIISAGKGTSTSMPVECWVSSEAGGPRLGSFASEAAGFDAAAGPGFVLPVTGRYRLTVKGLPPLPGEFIGRYWVWLHRHNREVERGPVTLVASDSVTDVFDYQGDEDEIRIQAAAGQLLRVFASRTGQRLARLEFSGPGVERRLLLELYPWNTDITRRYSEVLRLEQAGTYTLHLSGSRLEGYTLYAFLIDTLPEAAPVQLRVGDSVTETLPPFAGDVDEFVLTTDTLSHFNVEVRLPAGPAGIGATLLLLDETGTTRLLERAISSGNQGGMLGARVNAARRYRVRVIGAPSGQAADTAVFAGTYRLYTWPIHEGPEVASATPALDAVASDTLSPAGDLDTYSATLIAGQRYEVELTAGPGRNSARVTVPGVGNPSAPDLSATVDLSADGERLGRVARFSAPATGTYTWSVVEPYGAAYGRPHDAIPYRVRLRPFSADPESTGAVVALGDSGVGEAIDRLGDVDSFTITAAPGTLVHVVVRRIPPWIQFDLFPAAAWSMRSVGPDSLHWAYGVTVPPSGEIGVRFLEPPPFFGPIQYYSTGPIAFWTYPIVNPAPEGRPALMAPGDTVEDRIDTAGDVDEYRVILQAGQVYSLDITAPDVGIVVGVDDPAGTPLMAAWGKAEWQVFTREVTVTTTGEHTIRVTGKSSGVSTGVYSLRVRTP